MEVELQSEGEPHSTTVYRRRNAKGSREKEGKEGTLAPRGRGRDRKRENVLTVYAGREFLTMTGNQEVRCTSEISNSTTRDQFAPETKSWGGHCLSRRAREQATRRSETKGVERKKGRMWETGLDRRKLKRRGQEDISAGARRHDHAKSCQRLRLEQLAPKRTRYDRDYYYWNTTLERNLDISGKDRRDKTTL